MSQSLRKYRNVPCHPTHTTMSMSLPHTHTHRQNEHRNLVCISCYNDKSIFCYNLQIQYLWDLQIQYLSDFGHSQTIYQTTSVRNIIFENIGPDIACLDFDNTIPNLDIARSGRVEVPCTVRYFLASLAITGYSALWLRGV